VEIRLFELTTRVELSAFDDAAFHDAMLRARDRGMYSAAQVVQTVLNCLTGAVGIVAAAVVVAVLNPILLGLLVAAELPGGWAAVRSARIGYATSFALADSRRRKWILSDLMADRQTAAELRSFTLREFLLARLARLVSYERDAEIAVNKCYEEGLYFSDYHPAGAGRVRPHQRDSCHLHLPGRQRARAARCQRRNRPRPGGGPGGRERLRQDHPGQAAGRLYRPDCGTVHWDQTPVADIDPDQLREQIAVIAQDHANWPLTVRHNIAMGRAADPGMLASAAAVAGADKVILGLPRGYDTLLDRQFKDGVELSGGQWQRIAVARGFYRSAPLLIMDEPTAALDARAESALFASVREHAQGRTVLIITHRLASVRHADRVYVLHAGAVIEQGTHAELMARGGQYAELYTLQASRYDRVP
jgi:ATP-binding cassette, subfamily B, bacterial